MKEDGFRARVRRREKLCGTFVKTPAIEVIEVLALSGLDFLCLDTEHAAFDRARLDACLAMGRALGISCLVRVPDDRPAGILQALDSGANGIVVPHCFSAAKMDGVARAARFGRGGRGYAGSTRWAGFATRGIAAVRADDVETVVIGQIEEPDGVEAIADIAAVEGLDALFVGPADLAVCHDETDIAAPVVRAAIGAVCRETAGRGIAAATFAATTAAVPDLDALGVSLYFFASEQTWILQGAAALVRDFKAGT